MRRLPRLDIFYDRRLTIRFRIALILIGALFGACSSISWPGDSSEANGPRLVLWAWERPEDLRFIDPQEVGVAFLASSIRLAGDEVFVSLRRQALQVPRNTWLLAVAHVESDGRAPPVLSGRQRQRMVDALLEMARLSGLAGIQIDFDATKSQRTFYSKLVREVQAQKPESIRLSITALATWCWSDDWIRELPIDEAVPMLFRMGREAGTVRRRVVQGEDFLVASCRGSLGVSTDERFAFHPQRERLYVFNPHPWTPAALEGVLKWWRR